MNLRLALLLTAGLAAGPAAAGDAVTGPAPGIEWTPELTAYYSNVELAVPLTARPVPQLHGADELQLYRALLLEALRPQVLLFEASVYPMPVLGAWVRRRHPSLYDEARSGGTNWIEAVTAGFPEPAAVSVFLGSSASLAPAAGAAGTSNRAHVGTLLSFGTEHIAHNRLLHEPWYELEWKLKGDRQTPGRRLSWSFRLGTRQHSDPDIADTVYLGLKRGHLDFAAPVLTWLDNSDAELTVAACARGLAAAQVLAGKSYPLQRWHLALALQAGLVYESDRVYTGRLAEPRDNVIFVLRPNVGF
ncbi:MAG TPA: hypothetical protein VM369_06770 [Candidatus Binatia bacterium]|nr:hypothetical protein [Candidatus Binatia bacterium]